MARKRRGDVPHSRALTPSRLLPDEWPPAAVSLRKAAIPVSTRDRPIGPLPVNERTAVYNKSLPESGRAAIHQFCLIVDGPHAKIGSLRRRQKADIPGCLDGSTSDNGTEARPYVFLTKGRR